MKSREKVILAASCGLDFARNSIYHLRMTNANPFAGLGKALERLRKQAGFKTQKQAAAALGVDSGQLSRWENEVTPPNLENLGRLLAGYGATVVDLGEALGAVASLRAATEGIGEGPTDEELIRTLVEAIRRVEGRQAETESRVERIERGLFAAIRPPDAG